MDGIRGRMGCEWWCIATESKTDPLQPKAKATEKQTAADPRARLRPYIMHTSMHSMPSSHNEGTQAAGRAEQPLGLRRAPSAYSAAQQGAARGGVRNDRRGRAVAACWPQCWQTRRCWPCCAAGSQLQSRSCGEFLHHAMCGRSAVHAARSHGQQLVLLC